MREGVFILVIVFVLGSCQKFEEARDGQVYRLDSEEKMLEALTGAYARFKKIFAYPVPESDLAAEIAWFQEPGMKGDDFNHSHASIGVYYLEEDTFQYECLGVEDQQYYPYPEVEETWFEYYKTIATLNLIINQFEATEETNDKIQVIAGEAYLLRGYTYFRLTRVYGEIPLISDDEVSYEVEKSGFEAIYNFVEADLLNAIEYLPVNRQAARIPFATPHEGTAKAILAEVYLSRAGYPLKQQDYYQKAASTSGEVINQEEEYGFALVANFGRLWSEQYQWNDESVLALNYSLPSDFGFSIQAGNLSEDSASFNGLLVVDGFNYAPGFKFYNRFPENFRKTNTFSSINPIPDYDGEGFAYQVRCAEVEVMDPCTPVFYAKFPKTAKVDSDWHIDLYSDVSPGTIIWSRVNSRSYARTYNVYIYRYAQTLLTYAEAKARSGQLDASAYEAVNRVRRRAYRRSLNMPSEHDLMPGLSAEQFADSVVWERAWELCAEPEGRWFDLVRLEMVEELPSLRDESDMQGYPAVIDKDFYFTQIPESEIVLNPNLKK